MHILLTLIITATCIEIRLLDGETGDITLARHIPLTVPMVLTDNGNFLERQLILVINHRCNLKCRYCPTLRGLPRIEYDCAAVAIDLFLGQIAKKHVIKFSGGEPLLDPALLTDLMTFARNKARASGKKVRFQITTNGTLLDNRILDFLKEGNDTELMVSLDGDRYTQLRNRMSSTRRLNSFDNIMRHRNKLLSLPLVTINMVIAPNAAKRFYDNFLFILGLGFRRFNFLPAYFVYWNRESLKALEEGFERIALFLQNDGYNLDIYVKNTEVLNPTALFNDGLIVDCNGDIFSNNLFLSRRFSHLRSKLKLGSIQDMYLGDPLSKKPININSLIRQNTPRRILQSTQNADRILTGFVNLLKK